MTRKEHLAWCKERALEYLESGDRVSAIASMSSDIQKHPETRLAESTLATVLIATAMDGSIKSARQFIEGFN